MIATNFKNTCIYKQSEVHTLLSTYTYLGVPSIFARADKSINPSLVSTVQLVLSLMTSRLLDSLMVAVKVNTAKRSPISQAAILLVVCVYESLVLSYLHFDLQSLNFGQ